MLYPYKFRFFSMCRFSITLHSVWLNPAFSYARMHLLNALKESHPIKVMQTQNRANPAGLPQWTSCPGNLLSGRLKKNVCSLFAFLLETKAVQEDDKCREKEMQEE